MIFEEWWELSPLYHSDARKAARAAWHAAIAEAPRPEVERKLLQEVLNAGDNDGVWVNNWQDIRRRIRDHLIASKPQDGER